MKECNLSNYVWLSVIGNVYPDKDGLNFFFVHTKKKSSNNKHEKKYMAFYCSNKEI